MKESVTYQDILSEGAVAEAKKILKRLGQGRFGTPNARARSAVEKITDLEQLEALSERLLTVASWEELLSLPAARRSSRRHRSDA